MRGRATWISVVVVCAAAVAGWFALARPHPGGPVEPGGPGGPEATGPMSIWPESPFDPADALGRAQDRVDAGRDPWRRRADAVVVRFARNLFGWDRLETGDVVGGSFDGSEVHEIRPACTDCAEPGDWTGVEVDRLGRQGAGGIWSVVAATSERLRLPVAAASAVAAGDALSVRLDLPDDEHAAVGIRYVQRLRGGTSPDCGDGFEGRVGLTGAEGTVVVPDPLFDGAACAEAGAVGYLFAYSTSRITVQTGDPLLEPAAISGLAAVPVRLSQG